MQQRSSRDRSVMGSESKRRPLDQTADHDDQNGRGAHFSTTTGALNDVRDADRGTSEEQSRAESPPTARNPGFVRRRGGHGSMVSGRHRLLSTGPGPYTFRFVRSAGTLAGRAVFVDTCRPRIRTRPRFDPTVLVMARVRNPSRNHMVDYNLIEDLGIEDLEAESLLRTAFGDDVAEGDMDSLLGEDMDSFSAGTILAGKVVGFAGDFVVIDVGLKSEGLVPKTEFDDGAADLQSGDEVEVLLERAK